MLDNLQMSELKTVESLLHQSVWLAQLVKAPTHAAVCSITWYSRGPWFESRDRQLDLGFHPFEVGKMSSNVC